MSVSKETATPYPWGTGCLGWHLVQSDALSVIEERMPPGTTERLHFHARAQQLFYVLSGTATFELEGQVSCIKANEAVHVARGARHRIANQSQAPLVFLVISEPATPGDRHDG